MQWDTIYTYSRSQAVADGVQVDVTKTAQEAGICFPVFLTRGVYDAYVAVPPGLTDGPCGSHQDESGRLWDIVWMTRFAIMRMRAGRNATPAADRLPVALYVRQSDNHPARLMSLRATAGAVDIDDPAPAITVMLPDED